MKQLINRPDHVVIEAIQGLVSTHAHLQRLDGFPDIKVVIDRHHDKSKVAVISGGGSGHEPAHAGYVGSGMLAAAVCGEVFASPSAEAVLAAIRAVTGPAGCVLVVKNYTGDRLHFGLAAEQAKAEGFHVDMVVVGEDVAIEEPGLAGRRGLAGTVFVHKVAGAAAAAGCNLMEVVAVAQAVASAQGTLGVALRVCTLPGKEPSDRLGSDEIEIGLGIHGEPGTVKAQAMPADQLVDRMLSQIVASKHFGPIEKGEHLALMINNLGSSPALEMSLVARAVLACLSSTYGAVIQRLYVGPYMTSLDMAGMSITLLRLTQRLGCPDLLPLLDSPVGAPGWPTSGAAAMNPDADKPLPVPSGPAATTAAAWRPAVLSHDGVVLERALVAAASALLAAAPELDALDAKVGDGDCGSTLAHGAQAILTDIKTKYPLNEPAVTVFQVALSVRHGIGGTSGALYDVFLSAAARVLKENGPSCTAQAWAQAFMAGTEAVQKYGGATLGCRTMLDALLPAARACLQAVQQGELAAEVAAKAAQAARAGAEATKTMAASAGRSSYVPAEVAASVPDPGAVAVATWLEAVMKAIAQA